MSVQHLMNNRYTIVFSSLHHSPQQAPLEEIVHILEKSGVSSNTPSCRVVFPQTPPAVQILSSFTNE